MPEIEFFGRTFRSPVRLPPGYLLAPLTAAAILASMLSPSAGVRREVAEIVADGPERLAKVEAELDRTDPDWRLEQILSGRPPLPDDQNSARRVKEVVRDLPQSWVLTDVQGKPGPEVDAQKRVQAQPLGVRLEPEAAEAIDAVLVPLGSAVERARSLTGMGEGQHDVTFAENPLETVLLLTQQTRGVARLLQLDAAARAQRGDLGGAIESCQAILGASRSIGDEPFLISNLVRQAINNVAVFMFERVLAQGEPPPEALAALQRDLLAQGESSKLRNAIRGERAVMNDLLDKMATGRLSAADLAGSGGGEVENVPNGPGSAYYQHNQAMILETLTDVAEAASRPPHTWWSFVDRFDARMRQRGDEAHRLANVIHDLLLPNAPTAFEAEARTLAILRAGALLAASERFRQARGRWPESPDELVPEFLDAVPRDPYTSESMHLAHREDRLVAYAVGRDGQDDGGTLNPRNLANLPETDVGHVALDPDQRGREPELEATDQE